MPMSRTTHAGLGASILGAAVLSVALSAGMTAAFAQATQGGRPSAANSTASNNTVVEQKGPGLPPVDAHQSTRNTNNTEVFRLLGMSGQVNSPVTPAYNGAATYNTYAGQPGNGQNAILAAGADGSP